MCYNGEGNKQNWGTSMIEMPVKHFSWVDFIQGLKAAKFTDVQAEYLAKNAENLVENVLEHAKHELENKGLATKGDVLLLKQDIKALELEVKQNIKTLESEVKQDIKALELEVKQDIKALELEVKQDIKALELEVKQDMKTLELEVKQNIKTLELKIEQQKYASLKFTIWTGVGVVVTLGSALGSMIAHGFHWV